MGPQNGILGDDLGMELPETQVDTTAMAEEQKAARYSKSHEYKKLKSHWDERISYYQKFLPDGRPLTEATKEEREQMWIVANIVIAELQTVMNYYENAREVVESDAVQ